MTTGTSRNYQSAGEWDGHDAIALWIAAAAATLGLVVWCTGEFAALVFSRERLGTPLADIPAILWRLPGAWADPRTAWPPTLRASLPGPTAWWASAAAVLVVPAATARALTRRRVGRDNAWARSWDLRRLRRRGHSGRRLAIGTSRRRVVATESQHSLLVVGPTQTGKTTGLAVPAILEWEGPVVASSVKTDLLADTHAWRSGLGGEMWVYDPAGVTPFPLATWSPLAACRTWQGARRTAVELAEAAKIATGKGVESADFWFSSAAKLLAPYLFAAATRDCPIGDVVRWIDSQDRTEARSVLDATGHAEALLSHDATWRRDDKTRSSIYTTAELVLAAYGDPRVAASASTCQVRADRLLDGGSHTLYLTAPPADQRRLRSLFATLVGQVIGEAYAKVGATGKPLDPPLLVVLDEAANIAPVPDLATIASTAASHGIQLVTVWQDLAQLRSRYGGEAPTVLNNHRAKLVLAGVGDLETLDYVSRLAGDEEVEQTSVTTDRTGRRSTTAAARSRRLVAPESLRQLGRGEGVLLYGNLPAARVRLRPWFKDRGLRRRARRAVDSTAPGLAPAPSVDARVVPLRQRDEARQR